MTRRTKRVLIAGSVIWVIIVTTISILIYPKKRDDISLTNQELLALTMKENKTHEDNIAILDEFRSKGTLSPSKVKTQKILKEVKASLAFSIIQHQIEYNEKSYTKFNTIANQIKHLQITSTTRKIYTKYNLNVPFV